MNDVTYVGISRDHSGSMQSLTRTAARDYNECLSSLKDASLREGRATRLTVVKCGVGYQGKIHLDTLDRPISEAYPMDETAYEATGGSTPLFDSVWELITNLSRLDTKSATFLVMVITDGQDNASRISGRQLADRIRILQGTDRWTFTFRVPRGYKRSLVGLGIPEGNILEWEQTTQGMEQATIQTRSAITQYYAGVKVGKTASKTFYADLSNVTTSDVKAKLHDVTNNIKLYPVKQNDQLVIRKFMEDKVGNYEAGKVYYQLTKRENRVTDRKNIVVRDSKKGKYYSGTNARSLLGLPTFGTVKVVPDDLGKFDIFIQSTSYNRKLVPGTTVLVMR